MKLFNFIFKIILTVLLHGGLFLSEPSFAVFADEIKKTDSSKSDARIVSQSVGQVGDYIITSREVQIAAVVEAFIYHDQKKEEKKEIKIPELLHVDAKDNQFLNELNSYLLDQVVVIESENFSINNITNEDVNKIASQIRESLKQNSYWKSLEVTDVELKKIIKIKLTSKDFIKFKMSSVVSIITDQEALAYYEKNRAKFGNGNFDTFKSTIKNFLSQQQMEERLKSWFEIIKRKYKVRNFIFENQSSK